MGSHPINLAFRFLLELIALGSVGVWAWRQDGNWRRYLLVWALPLALAAVWGTFAVPDDPSRSGSAPIPVAGILRLIIELAIFSLATWMLYDLDYPRISWGLGIMVIIYYLVSYDRIQWLLSR